MGRRSSPAAQRRIIEAALKAFNLDGVRGVSADTIIKQANVAKMTLYKYYPTKDALATASVRERSDRWLAWLAKSVGKAGRTPSQRVLSLFDALDEWFKSDDYYGCPFHREAAEFPDLKNPIHKEVVRNKQQLRALVREMVREAGIGNQLIVHQLLVLMAGAEVMANIEGDPKYSRYARQAANKLMRS